ncbi:type 1 periplasmic binding fold superfamily protein [Costertonia aggregata]|uniref:Type 1 periplasmic binding fold superfamily protein n=1 Tax=Costertonia aggregata TaxID=343403 RepID=A0A7H9AV02_9FLAO|nr:type 1 periplasmic binding fold superfamily protein [Costertonia aggregata]QLG47321.1 type 1 periplasmic binding fold superfamily protein [Costertonia aggregata]
MQSLRKSSILFTAFVTLGFLSCSDDDNDPDPVNEEEVITTMTVTLVPQGGGNTVTLTSRDLDGDGPDAPVLTVSENFVANTTYTGSVVLLNETETPAELVNEEIEGEADEHQFFFVVGSGLNVTTTYGDDESDYVSAETGQNFTSTNPVGIDFTLETAAASTGTFTVTLRHEPKKPNDGTLADAGGETDIAQTFTVTIQ